MSTAVTQPMPIVDDRVEGIEDSVEDGGSLTAAAEAFAAPDARTLSDVHIAEPPSSAPGRGSRGSREARDAAAGVYRFTADAGDAAEARRKKKRPSTP